MKHLIPFFSSVFLFASVASAEIVWTKKDYPEIKYVFEDTNEKLTAASANSKEGGAGFQRLVKKATELKLTYAKTYFTKIEAKNQMSKEIGLHVSGDELAKVPADKIRTRPAGPYLVAAYKGPNSNITEVFKQVPQQLKAKNSQAKEPIFYLYRSPGSPNDKDASTIFLFPLK